MEVGIRPLQARVASNIPQHSLENGFDFRVERKVGLREAVDLVGVFRRESRVECEVEKAADVVILVENAKGAFGFVARKSEIGQRERGSEAWG